MILRKLKIKLQVPAHTMGKFLFWCWLPILSQMGRMGITRTSVSKGFTCHLNLNIQNVISESYVYYSFLTEMEVSEISKNLFVTCRFLTCKIALIIWVGSLSTCIAYEENIYIDTSEKRIMFDEISRNYLWKGLEFVIFLEYRNYSYM